MRVTNRALAILYSDDDGERISQLRGAAFEPTLFRELHDRWPNMVPPEEGVVMYLNRQGFNQNAVRPAARAYLDTLLFLQEQGATESHGRPSASDAESSASTPPKDEKAMPSTSSAPAFVRTPNAPQPAPASLNRIDMNIQGDKVHINGLLDYAGLVSLEKKIAALKILLESAANDAQDENG
jgi:hypothetical protein